MFVPNYECFECGALAEEKHHVIPKSLGGTKTIPLCSNCHSRVHDGLGNRRDQHKELTLRAFNRKQSELFFNVWWNIFKEPEEGMSVEELAEAFGTTPATIKEKIKRLKKMDLEFLEELMLPHMGEEYEGFSFFNLDEYTLSTEDINKLLECKVKTMEECIKEHVNMY